MTTPNNPTLTTRLTYPEDRTTFVYGPPGTPIRTPPRTGVKLFVDEECSIPADVEALHGGQIPHSTIYTGEDGLLPEFLGPTGFVPRLWARVVGGTATPYPLMAQYSDQLGNLPFLLNGEGPPSDAVGAVGAFYIDNGTSNDPNVPDNKVIYGPRTPTGWPLTGTPLRGPKGEPGQTITWYQTTPSSEWRIPHTLPYKPSVTTIDSAGSQFFGDVYYPPDEPQVVLVRVGAPESGEAELK